MSKSEVAQSGGPAQHRQFQRQYLRVGAVEQDWQFDSSVSTSSRTKRVGSVTGLEVGARRRVVKHARTVLNESQQLDSEVRRTFHVMRSRDTTQSTQKRLK